MAFSNPRQSAAQILIKREEAQDYIEDLVAAELSHHRGPSPDRALIQELCYGVVRWRTTLDWLIGRKTTPGRSQKTGVQTLLRLGLYQLFWLERIPDHAAVNEVVEVAKRLGFGPQAGFVNALLRTYLRERIQTERLIKELKADNPALGHSHPEWLFDKWATRWDAASAVQLMEWNNRPPQTFGRVNTLRTTSTALTEAWKAEGVEFELVLLPWLPSETIFRLTTPRPWAQLSSFQAGHFYIQDPSTLLACLLLDPRPGESVLDVCAAPGGKTTFLAQLIKNQGAIVAFDAQPNRLNLVRENCSRLGASCVTLADHSTLDSLSGRTPFDRILVDAPCSNSGVMRRRVDLRWRISQEEIQRLQRTQGELLARTARRLAPGGHLVYSTCSLEPEENEQITQAFLAEHAEFKLDASRELWPFRDQVDGAYVARFRKCLPNEQRMPPSELTDGKR